MTNDESTMDILHEWIEQDDLYNRTRRRLVEYDDGDRMVWERQEQKTESGEWELYAGQRDDWVDVPCEFVEVGDGPDF